MTEASQPRNAIFVAIRRTWRLIAVLLLMMTLFRLVFVIQFAHPEVWSRFLGTLPMAFAFGALHDLRIMLLFALPPSLSLLWMRNRGRKRWRSWLRRTATYWFVGITALLIILASDQLYFAHFRSHFNILAFGALDDDLGAVLRGAWRNYPLLLYVLLGLVGAAAVFKVIAKAFHIDDFLHDEVAPSAEAVDNSLNRHIVLHVLLAVAFCSTPLEPVFERLQEDIRPTPFVRVVPDSPVEKLAETVWKRISEEPLSTARRFGYDKDLQRAVVDFTQDQAARDTGPIWQRLPIQQFTPEIQTESPPHVVIVLMESFSSYLLRYQSPEFDLLGNAAPYFERGLNYERFLPADNISAGSLISLLLEMPYRPGTRQLSQNELADRTYPGSAALLFGAAGYESNFFYGGPKTWRNLDRFLPQQGFDRVVDQEELTEQYQLDLRVDAGEWGLWDEHLFRAVEDHLAKATSPQFVVVFTTTNHPPYELPFDTELPALDPPQELLELTGKLDETQVRQMRTYQYACRQLGTWLDRLEQQDILQNTVVGVTGDHAAGLRLPQSRSELLMERAVPFLVLLPPEIAAQAPYDPGMPGSHKDVVPTLYHAAGLAQAGYRGFGTSMLDPQAPHFGVNASGLLIDHEGAVILTENTAVSTAWADDHSLLVDPRAPAQDPQELVRRYQAALALVDALVYEEESAEN